MLEFPFSIKWTISEENLRAFKNSNGKEYLKSDTFTAFNFSPISYHFELYPNGNSYENLGTAHESLFVSESPIFAAMFEQLKDENEKIIEIPDFSFEIVQKAIKLIYHRDLVQEIPLKDAFLFLKFAITYDLSTLKNNLELYVGCNLTIVKVYDAINTAKELNAEKLQNICMDFLVDSISKQRFVPNVTDLDKECIKELFQTFLCKKSETFLCAGK
uniref:BTB domain-containing protein n=1 Tax=Panagrolaimus davidi TaxID=227884 RepID=A0A914QJG9_9BILA